MICDVAGRPIEVASGTLLDANVHDGSLRPVTLAQVVFALWEAGNVENSLGPTTVVGPNNLAQVGVTDPHELTNAPLRVAYRTVVARFVIGCRAQQNAVRVTCMLGGVEAVGVNAVD